MVYKMSITFLAGDVSYNLASCIIGLICLTQLSIAVQEKLDVGMLHLHVVQRAPVPHDLCQRLPANGTTL